MAVKKIPQANALTFGAELWILPDLAHSSWTQTIDWYVNFQFSKARLHSPAKFSSELQNLVDHYSSEVFRIEVRPSAPLFLATERLLPNRETVVIPYYEKLAPWLERAASIWSGLNSPQLRIFLPDGVASSEFGKIWDGEKAGSDVQVTFVSDR